MKRIIQSSILVLVFSLMACINQNKPNTKEQSIESSKDQTTQNVNSFVSLFEIPATDISRAINFYKTILNIDIEKIEMPEMEMGIFPYEQQVVTGVIIKAEGYKPSANGVTIYLNGGNNLQTILDKVETNGGKIIIPKTPHADNNGFFALFLDSEGNKMGLNSPN